MTRQFTTFQDLEKQGEGDRTHFVRECIDIHRTSAEVQLARLADLYDRQLNKTINEYVQTIYSLTGASIENVTATNNKIASNFFEQLVTQRVSYSLANGVQFTNENTRAKLGVSFDEDIYTCAYDAVKHGCSFLMWNVDRTYVFPFTEFVPMYDEYTGALRAGIRYWRLAYDRPLQAVLYEEDGYTIYRATDCSDDTLSLHTDKQAYVKTYQQTMVDDPVVVGEENYSNLPIIPMYGSRHHQSGLVGVQQAIDSYDIIKSGFANDVTDCAQIYWLIENYGGMTERELARWRERLQFQHIAEVDTSDGGKISPYTQEVPYAARAALLEELRSGIYRDFGALDVAAFASAQKTATEIKAAYQPVDNKAADFELQVTKCIKQLLALLGIDDSPMYLRNKVTNVKEDVEIVMAEANYLDEETLLRKLPNIASDEVPEILARKDAQALDRFNALNATGNGEESSENDEEDEEE